MPEEEEGGCEVVDEVDGKRGGLRLFGCFGCLSWQLAG